jgi:N-methylhydantoinase A
VNKIKSTDVESVAVCLLFSFLRPEHEVLLADTLRNTGFFVSPSVEILPEFREFERMSTTTVNAYVSPVLDRYLGDLQTALNTHQDEKTQKENSRHPHIRIWIE